MMKREVENNVYELTSDFAIRIIKLYQFLEQKNERIMSKQLLRSGTSIGANVFKGKDAYSKDDFAFKMSIALKEAGESGYWIDLLHKTNYLDDTQYDSLFKDWNRIYAVLVKIVKATKTQISNPQNRASQTD